MPVFVSGLDLSRRFFREIVRPLLATAFPNLHYAATLLGPGSEVLGFDTEMSVDHDWGRACSFSCVKKMQSKVTVSAIC